jgi:lysozyme
MMVPRALLRSRRFLLGGIAVFALLVFGIFFAVRGWAPSRANYPSQGIDVSQEQGEIDWKSVQSDGVEFAYIRATQSAEGRDQAFEANWKDSAEAGVRRGAVHHFTLCRLARDQATNFISIVPRDDAALPPALELTVDEECASQPSRDVVLSEIAAYTEMVEAAFGKPILISVSKPFEEQYRISEAVDRPLWLRHNFFPPDYGSHPWVMWQASSIRRVGGISGAVNWNVLRS